MYKYTRKYYIHDQEVSFENLMKYIEIKLQYDDYPLDSLGIRFETIKEKKNVQNRRQSKNIRRRK